MSETFTKVNEGCGRGAEPATAILDVDQNVKPEPRGCLT